MSKSTAKGWRQNREHISPYIENPDSIHPIPPTRFFDQLSYIGDNDVGSFLLETSAGLVLIDCGWPTAERVNMIENGIKELGLRCEDLVCIIVTHGHGDHWGCADHFREKYGAKIYMTEIDYNYARDPVKSPRRQLHYEVFDFLTDGETLRIGTTEIHVVLTPGHTPGCISLIIPITDEGRPHFAALWGGTGIGRSSKLERRYAYLSSLYKFREECSRFSVDVEIAVHPFVDNSEQRLALCRSICNGVPNPYVIGQEAYHRYEDMLFEKVLETIDPSEL